MLGCEPTASGCLRAFVARFGKLAYRRPLETVELDSVVNRATADALDATDQFRFAIEVMLSASNFLYRVEVGNAADAIATLTPTELASRLSFSLWGRGPDATLLDQAAAGCWRRPKGWPRRRRRCWRTPRQDLLPGVLPPVARVRGDAGAAEPARGLVGRAGRRT